MADSRKRRSSRGKRLSSKSQRKVKKKPQSRWRNLPPIILILIAGGAFAFLIVVGLGVRFVVMQAEGDVDKIVEPVIGVQESTDNEPTERFDVPSLSELTQVEFSASPDESQYETLPPPAAKKKKRKIPGLLLVGEDAGMFTELHDALKVAIPGDAIEIRTNRPLYVAECTIGSEHFEDEEQRAFHATSIPIVVRAGEGFTPLIRHTQGEYPRHIETIGNTLWFQGLHFHSRPKNPKNESGVYWLYGPGNRIYVRDCTFNLGNLFTSSTHEASELLTDPDDPRRSNQILFERCLFVAAGGVSGTDKNDVRVVNSGFLFCPHFSKFRAAGCRCEFYHCTAIHSYGVLCQSSPVNRPFVTVECRWENSIIQNLWCCPHLLHGHAEENDFAKLDNPVQLKKYFDDRFPNFQTTGNLMMFHDMKKLGWADIYNHSSGEREQTIWISVDSSPKIAAQIHQLSFNENIESLRHYTPEINDLARKGRMLFHPRALIAYSDTPSIQRRLSRRQVGCVPEQLPVPRPETIEHYDPPLSSSDEE